MIWLNPAALFALAAGVAPILIHILIQRRAERFPFPTLRFLRPTRLAAIRRHVLEDLPLLAVRVALLAAAVAALAGPLLVTAARRQAWERRVVRAIVEEAAPSAPAVQTAAAAALQARGREQAFLQQTFQASSVVDGIRRAVLWLDTAPPAQREIVIASAFPIGALSEADLAAIPPDVGIRLERTGTLPETRTVTAGTLLTAGGTRVREVTFDRDRTLVRDEAAAMPVPWPIEITAPPGQQPAIDAAIAAVLSQHVRGAPNGRRARLVLTAGTAEELKARTTTDDAQAFGPAVTTISSPWMADAVARIARDGDLRAAAARVPAGLAEARFTAAPWQVLASAADGHPLAAAAGSATQLVVASAANAWDMATPLLLRSIADAIAPVSDLQRAEVVQIPVETLQRWSRPSSPTPSPRIGSSEGDDRRWFWLVAVALLAFEIWVRRPRRDAIPRESPQEDARVA